jgi:translocator protein
MILLSDFKTYIKFIAFTLLVGILSGILTRDSVTIYQELIEPPLAPPSYIFPIVWTILYILMGISVAIIYNTVSNIKSIPIVIYLVQLFFNFMWSVIFFNFGCYLFAFIWLLILLIIIFIMIINFYKINKVAGILLFPYFLWVLFAGYLNIAIYILNR